jgi:hypothetical protein
MEPGGRLAVWLVWKRLTLEFRSAYPTRQCLGLLHGGQVDLAWITLGQPQPGIQQRPIIRLPWILVRDSP